LSCQSNDQGFLTDRDAAKYRQREIGAAIKIQRKWKGHNTRLFFKELEYSDSLLILEI
jgi:hypothetical protein